MATEAIPRRAPIGTRVELIYMDDPYNRKFVPRCQGTVRWGDDMGDPWVVGLRLWFGTHPRRGYLEENLNTKSLTPSSNCQV